MQAYLLLGLLLCFDGCGPQTTPKTASIQQAKNVEVSAAELASRDRSLLAVYSSEIEEAADRVIARSPSATARRQALVWKAEAIPVLQSSLLNADPVAAAIDAWAFIYQMRDYMARPEIEAGFGDFKSVPAETLDKMDREMERLILVAAPAADIADIRRRIGAWAANHPIQAGLNGRESVDPEFVRKADTEDLGALASLKALQEGLGDITARLDSYNAYLPKEARWQAELFVNDLTRGPQFSTATSSLAAASKTLDQASALTEQMMGQMPELAGKASKVREALREDVDAERLAAQAFLREERLETLEFLMQQRVDATADLRAERLAATEDLRGERRIVLDAIQKDEETALKEARAISQDTVQTAAQNFEARSRGLIDHAFWRALQLVLITAALVLVLGSLAARIFWSHQRSR